MVIITVSHLDLSDDSRNCIEEEYTATKGSIKDECVERDLQKSKSRKNTHISLIWSFKKNVSR